VDYWVLAGGPFAEVCKHSVNIRIGQELGQIIHEPHKWLVIKSRAGDRLKELPKQVARL
jgi:hypothetical protein